MKAKILLALSLMFGGQAYASDCNNLGYFDVDGIDTLQGSRIYTYAIENCDTLVFRRFHSKLYGTERVIADSKNARLDETQRSKITGEWLCSKTKEDGECVDKTRYSWNEDKTKLTYDRYRYTKIKDFYDNDYEEKTDVTITYEAKENLIVARKFKKVVARRGGEGEEWLTETKESIEKHDPIALFSNPNIPNQ